MRLSFRLRLRLCPTPSDLVRLRLYVCVSKPSAIVTDFSQLFWLRYMRFKRVCLDRKINYTTRHVCLGTETKYERALLMSSEQLSSLVDMFSFRVSFLVFLFFQGLSSSCFTDLHVQPQQRIFHINICRYFMPIAFTCG